MLVKYNVTECAVAFPLMQVFIYGCLGEVTQSSKSSVSKGAIGGAVGGSVVFLGVIVLVIFAVIRKRKANHSAEQNGAHGEAFASAFIIIF